MKFTIVTPHFNQLEWLRLCVASVADQVKENGLFIEHIIQDAGTMGMEDFARAHGAAFYSAQTSSDIPNRNSQPANTPYRLTIYSEPDAGMYDAINRGFRRATGDIVAWLNADEQYLPGSLGKVAAAFKSHPEAEMIFGDAVVTDPSGEYLCSRTAVKPQRLHSLGSGNLSFLSAANFVRRDVINKGHLIPEGWRVVGDAAWAVDLLAAGVSMRRLPDYISSFVDTGDNLSIRKGAREEHRRLAGMAPTWARVVRPLLIAGFRCRKLLAGAYYLKPFSYEVFTKGQPSKRQRFQVTQPAQRWRGRSL
jgi:glycosyltransferase involved in cell wall biosynthesis